MNLRRIGLSVAFLLAFALLPVYAAEVPGAGRAAAMTTEFGWIG